MVKNIAIITTFFFSFLFAYVAHPGEISSVDISSRTGKEKDVKIYSFDGVNLNLINNATNFIRENNNIKRGKYFAFFFLKDGYMPEIKIVNIGKGENKILGKIKLKERIPPNKGILTGVIYKPVHGGKLSFKKGIYKLIDKSKIKIIDGKNVSQLISADCNGIFKIALIPGEYMIVMGEGEKDIPVMIKNNNVTIKNIQKGAMLID